MNIYIYTYLHRHTHIDRWMNGEIDGCIVDTDSNATDTYISIYIYIDRWIDNIEYRISMIFPANVHRDDQIPAVSSL